MSNYLVSILVPIYGVEKYIERCSRSLMEQTYDNIEYIFVDDCSKDKSLSILEKVIVEYPNRKSQVKIIHQSYNQGLAVARNTAVSNASGEFLMHVDSDDYISLDCVEKCVLSQIVHNADIVSFGRTDHFPTYTVTMLPPKITDKEVMLNEMISRNGSVAIWGRLIRRSLYVDNNIKVEPQCNIGEDYQVVPLLFYYAKSFSNIQEPLYEYNRQNEGSYTWIYSEKIQDEDFKSAELVACFFKDKGAQYVRSSKLAYQRLLTKSLKSLLVNNGSRERFKKLKTELEKGDDVIKKDLPFFERALLCFDSYSLLRLYFKTALFVKHRILKK